MKNKLFKWMSKKSFDNDPIVWAVTESMIQQEAESEIGRRLSELEIERLVEAMWDDKETAWNSIVLIREAINSIVGRSK
jgi:hypothetical protein